MRTILLFLTLILSVHFGYGQENNLDSLMNRWHKAAGTANYAGYFGFMSDDFVFLGTAPGERWDKIAFSTFSKPYFDKGKAWNFTPSNRIWMYSSDSTIAWFDEDLDTWMRGCRGSGILVRKNGEWKILYYNLTVLIENEKIKQFIELRDQKASSK
jgi:hypothetical protein